jgi:hypothetical protein
MIPVLGWAKRPINQVDHVPPRSSTAMSTENTEIANIILQQLGGRRFVAMTGSKNFIAGDHRLTFSIVHGRDGINACEIKLDPSDTYMVRFYRVGDRRTGYKHTDKSVHTDIYAEDLQELFTRQTGLYTHL